MKPGESPTRLAETGVYGNPSVKLQSIAFFNIDKLLFKFTYDCKHGLEFHINHILVPIYFWY